MGFDVVIKGSTFEDATPKYDHSYSTTERLCTLCPVVDRAIFHTTDPHDIRHASPKVAQSLRALDAFLRGYVDKAHRPLLSSLILAIRSDGILRTLQSRGRFGGLSWRDYIRAKEAAFSLKQVLELALAQRKDIHIY